MSADDKYKEGIQIDTGLRLRGFEVWATTPHHYRHGHELAIFFPKKFPTVVKEDDRAAPAWRWAIGFTRPDGIFVGTYQGWRTEAEAMHARETYAGAKSKRYGCMVSAGWKRRDGSREIWCEASNPGAYPRGSTWADPQYDDHQLCFTLTEDEALMLIEWRVNADQEWHAANRNFLEREEKILALQVAGLSPTVADLVVSAEALDVAILQQRLPELTECLECGAVYSEPGHVESGGMGCDQCG